MNPRGSLDTGLGPLDVACPGLEEAGHTSLDRGYQILTSPSEPLWDPQKPLY